MQLLPRLFFQKQGGESSCRNQNNGLTLFRMTDIFLKYYLRKVHFVEFLCFVDRASRYNRVKKNQLDAQLIPSIFRQPVHVLGVSRPIIRKYNRMYTTISTYYSF